MRLVERNLFTVSSGRTTSTSEPWAQCLMPKLCRTDLTHVNAAILIEVQPDKLVMDVRVPASCCSETKGFYIPALGSSCFLAFLFFRAIWLGRTAGFGQGEIELLSWRKLPTQLLSHFSLQLHSPSPKVGRNASLTRSSGPSKSASNTVRRPLGSQPDTRCCTRGRDSRRREDWG